MAPRKGNNSVKSSGSTSKKAEPLPDWVKSGGKPPPKDTGPTTTSYTRRDGTVVTQTHLFPPNTKTPINLLHERVQKTHQWNKVELRPHLLPGSQTAYTCSVILTKPNKADAAHPFRIELRPPHRLLGSSSNDGGAAHSDAHSGNSSNDGGVSLDAFYISVDSSEKAKHWGATYALFRLFSSQQFGRILPTLAGNEGGGPREYWAKMEAWLETPEAKSWLAKPAHADYLAADPFDAQAKRERELKERQIKETARAAAIEKGQAPIDSGHAGAKGSSKLSKAWAEAKEVRMASSLRELVERTIRGAMQVFGESALHAVDDDLGDSAQQVNTEENQSAFKYSSDTVSNALHTRGFRAGYVRSALRWLQNAATELNQSGPPSKAARDPLLAALRNGALSPTEAAVQYLVLYVPEEDLPPQLRPSAASDNFVSAAIGAGDREDDLAWRWCEDATVKEIKWPRKAVKSAVQDIRSWLSSQSISSSQKLDAAARRAFVTDVLLARLGGASDSDSATQTDKIFNNVRAALDATDDQIAEVQQVRDDERMAIEAVLGEERVKDVEDQPHTFDVSLTHFPGAKDSLPAHAHKEEVRLRFYSHALSLYPSADRPQNLPTFAVVSSTLPSYLCLALTKRLVEALSSKPDLVDILEAGLGGAFLGMVEELEGDAESAWWKVLDEPPSLDKVMAGLVKLSVQSEEAETNLAAAEDASTTSKPAARLRNVCPPKPLKRDVKVDQLLLAQHESLRRRPDHQDMIKTRQSLPAFNSREQILSFLSGNASTDNQREFAGRVLIVAGETGCGKSTQTPQYILEDAIARSEGSLCNIVVTQPRRVSAMGLAARVAAERGEEWNDSASGSSTVGTVGYAIRGERRASQHTRLLFTTTGVLLRRLSAGSDPDLRSVSHVVVDEVHERSIDSDVLLLELRELLRRNWTIKVVLMSATIQQELFVDYFGGAPCLQIPGRTFAVKDLYIEDVMGQLEGWEPSASLVAAGRYAEAQQKKREQAKKEQEATPGSKAQLKLRREAAQSDSRASTPASGGDESAPVREPNGSTDQKTTGAGKSTGLSAQRQLVLAGLQHSDRTDFDLLGAVVRHVVRQAERDEAQLGSNAKGGAILVFCSGVGEIRQATDAITRSVNSRVDVLPLHANLSPAEQRKVFQRPRPGHRKIVVSTNVAETSITISDISYVVDTGRVKETRYNPESGLTSLVEGWASRAACKQRRGRAGRVREGVCYKLFSRQTELDKLAKQTMPEMLRVPLENVFLQCKAMHADVDLREMLSKALSPPGMASMSSALQNLMEAGAMRSDQGFKSRLTALGKHLSNLPLDVRLGKLLVFGALFGVLSPMLTVAAIMSSKPLFVSPTRDNDAIARARKGFAIGTSDLLTDANAFNSWQLRSNKKMSHSELRDWCEANNLSQGTLRDIYSLRFELLGNLQDLGFAHRHQANEALPLPSLGPAAEEDMNKLQQSDCNALNLNMLRAILAAALWPSVVRIQMPAQQFSKSTSGTLLRDPEAKTIKYFDRVQGRLFLFNTSVNFDVTGYSSAYMSVFQKAVLKQSAPRGAIGGTQEKIMMRDANEVPTYALLLFGGKLTVNSAVGGISIGSAASSGVGASAEVDDSDDEDGQRLAASSSRSSSGWVKVRASARIAVLCSQLRSLLDAVLDDAVEDPETIAWDAKSNTHQAQVLKAIVALLTRDGVTDL
ncbi:hypothetical protein V8E36_005696 [Tilletia maclaganii]